MVDSKMKQNITIRCNTAIGNAYETQTILSENTCNMVKSI